MDLQQLFAAFRDHTGGGTTIQREPASVARHWFTWSISDWFVECCSWSLDNHICQCSITHYYKFLKCRGTFFGHDHHNWVTGVANVCFAHCIRSDRRDFNKFWPKLVSLLRRYSVSTDSALICCGTACFHTWERRFGTDCRGLRTVIEFDSGQCLI